MPRRSAAAAAAGRRRSELPELDDAATDVASMLRQSPRAVLHFIDADRYLPFHA